MKRLIRLSAPYIAVIPFWCVYRHAWLCIIVYHAQALLWSHRDLRLLTKGWDCRTFILSVLPCALAGPLALVLLPLMVSNTSLEHWLDSAGLSGPSHLLMIPYFGLVHPMIEQAHWGRLRAETPWAHLAFAAYHLPVLASLLGPAWLALCFAVLLVASHAWSAVQKRTDQGLLVPFTMHAAADLGLVSAAWFILWRG